LLVLVLFLALKSFRCPKKANTCHRRLEAASELLLMDATLAKVTGKTWTLALRQSSPNQTVFVLWQAAAML
jgi:hypothetical protein